VIGEFTLPDNSCGEGLSIRIAEKSHKETPHIALCSLGFRSAQAGRYFCSPGRTMSVTDGVSQHVMVRTTLRYASQRGFGIQSDPQQTRLRPHSASATPDFGHTRLRSLLVPVLCLQLIEGLVMR
jgi:hypothetical protein